MVTEFVFWNQAFRARGPHWCKKNYFKYDKLSHPTCMVNSRSPWNQLHTRSASFFTLYFQHTVLKIYQSIELFFLITVAVSFSGEFLMTSFRNANLNEIGKITHSIICAADYFSFQLVRDHLQMGKWILMLMKRHWNNTKFFITS